MFQQNKISQHNLNPTYHTDSALLMHYTVSAYSQGKSAMLSIATTFQQPTTQLTLHAHQNALHTHPTAFHNPSLHATNMQTHIL